MYNEIDDKKRRHHKNMKRLLQQLFCEHKWAFVGNTLYKRQFAMKNECEKCGKVNHKFKFW